MAKTKGKAARKLLEEKQSSISDSQVRSSDEHTTVNDLQVVPEEGNDRPSSTAIDGLKAAIFEHAKSKYGDPLPADLNEALEKRFKQFAPQLKTPDHPPYAAMIFSAITDLGEEGGSSEESISAYIREKWESLSLAHDSFLKLYLGKLTEKGEIIATRSGLYMFPKRKSSRRIDMETERELSFQGIQKKPLMAVVEEKGNKVQALIEPELPPCEESQAARHVVSTIIDAGNNVSSSPVKRRGRPPKSKQDQSSNQSPLKAQGGESDLVAVPITESMPQAQPPKPAKRRGRPPKPKQGHESSSQSPLKAQGGESDVAAQPPAATMAEGETSPAKRRGRPPKGKQAGGSKVVNGGTSDGATSEQEETEPSLRQMLEEAIRKKKAKEAAPVRKYSRRNAKPKCG